MNSFCRQLTIIFSLFPFGWMVFLHVFGIVIHQLKIFYPIICLIAVDVVDALARLELSSKVLLHDVSMLKDSLTVYIDTKIAIFCQTWFTFLESSPVGFGVESSMPKLSTSVHLTNKPLSFLEDIFAAFNLAYSLFRYSSHKGNYNTMGYISQ